MAADGGAPGETRLAGHTEDVGSADLTSWTLILGAATGSPLDRETFSVRYAPAIRAYLAARWRLDVNHDGVLDATQDVMVECFKDGGALSRVDPGCAGGFRAFLYGVVRNVALMAERRLARRREVDPGAAFDIDQVQRDEATLSLVFDRAFARAVARQARELLARRSIRSPAAELRFRALALQFENCLLPRDVAAALGLPAERVYELLKEARREYRQALLDVVGSLHPDCGREEIEQRCVELMQRLA